MSEQKHANGRPRFNLDLSEVEKLCAIGCTHQEIADWLRVSKRALEYWLDDEQTLHPIKDSETGKTTSHTLREIMDRGYARMKISIRRQQIKLLQEGNATMGVWLGKQWLGQTDRTALEHSGPGGQPIPVIISSVLDEKE